jgi:hypothetical protein
VTRKRPVALSVEYGWGVSGGVDDLPYRRGGCARLSHAPRTLPKPFGLGPHRRRDGRRFQGRRLFNRLEVLHTDVVVFFVDVQLEERVKPTTDSLQILFLV